MAVADAAATAAAADDNEGAPLPPRRGSIDDITDDVTDDGECGGGEKDWTLPLPLRNSGGLRVDSECDDVLAFVDMTSQPAFVEPRVIEAPGVEVPDLKIGWSGGDRCIWVV